MTQDEVQELQLNYQNINLDFDKQRQNQITEFKLNPEESIIQMDTGLPKTELGYSDIFTPENEDHKKLLKEKVVKKMIPEFKVFNPFGRIFGSKKKRIISY